MISSDFRASFSGFVFFALLMSLGSGCKGGSGARGYPDAVAGTGGRSANNDGGGFTDGGSGGGASGDSDGNLPDDGGASGAGGGTAAGGASGGGGGLSDGGVVIGTGGTTNAGSGGGTAGAGSGSGGRGTGGVGIGGASPDAGAATGGSGGGPPASAAVRVLGGPAQLISSGQSCSTPPTPPGAKPDEWCAAIRPGTVAGTISLAVFNLTKAMAGTAPTCAAGDPNCLALSASISTDGPHGFFGETLIYYDAASVFVWKPGWTAGRVLLQQDQLASCVAGLTGATAICVKFTADPAVQNLYAGRIDTQAGSPIPLIEPYGAEGSSVGFNTDYQSVIWSTKASAAALEVLKIQTIGDAASRRTVATNVTDWAQTPDGLRWLWRSQPVIDPTTGWITGTLQTAPFPAGTLPTNIHTAVVQYAPWSNRALTVLATPGALGADLKAIIDIDNPTTSTRILHTADALGFTGLTTDGTVLYYNDFFEDPADPTFFLINLLTSKADGIGKCTVISAPDADGGATLNRTATGVTWARLNVAGTAYDGVFTPLPGCSPRIFSTSVGAFFEVGAGVMVQENFTAQAFTASLGFVPLAADGSPGAKVVVHTAADSVYWPLFPSLPRVVYSVNQTLLDSGIYVSRTLTGTSPAFFRLDSAEISASAAKPVAIEPRAAFARINLTPSLAGARPTTRAALLRNLRLTNAPDPTRPRAGSLGRHPRP